MSRAEPAAEIVRGDFVLETMSEHDLLEVVEIEEACSLSLWGWEAYRLELDRPEAIMLVARNLSVDSLASERELLGFIAARVSAGELHVNNIGVREMYRRNGVGGALLGRVLEVAGSYGVRSALLEVRSANEVAQTLYRRYGFEVMGRRRNYYRDPTDDALVMSRRLQPEA